MTGQWRLTSTGALPLKQDRSYQNIIDQWINVSLGELPQCCNCVFASELVAIVTADVHIKPNE